MITSQAREQYRKAHSFARRMGARRILLSQDRHNLQSILYREYGVRYADKILHTYRLTYPERDLMTLKYLFALMAWSHRSEDHWRALQRDYGRDSSIAESARKVWEYYEDLYYTESARAGGMLSISETSRIVWLWHTAREWADWRKQYGDNWRFVRARAQAQILAIGKRASLTTRKGVTL